MKPQIEIHMHASVYVKPGKAVHVLVSHEQYQNVFDWMAKHFPTHKYDWENYPRTEVSYHPEDQSE